MDNFDEQADDIIEDLMITIRSLCEKIKELEKRIENIESEIKLADEID